MANTASTIEGVSCSASAALILVERDVRATERSSSRSIERVILKVSRNFNVSVLAISYPSVMMRGCKPSCMCRSACLRSSPTISTTEVVPSPQMSSCAVAALAIMTAVGFCICLSLR